MIAIDTNALIAIAAVIGSISSLVWSIRRDPGSSRHQAEHSGKRGDAACMPRVDAWRRLRRD